MVRPHKYSTPSHALIHLKDRTVGGSGWAPRADGPPLLSRKRQRKGRKDHDIGFVTRDDGPALAIENHTRPASFRAFPLRFPCRKGRPLPLSEPTTPGEISTTIARLRLAGVVGQLAPRVRPFLSRKRQRKGRKDHDVRVCHSRWAANPRD